MDEQALLAAIRRAIGPDGNHGAGGPGPIARPEDGEDSRRDPRDQKLSDRRVGAVRDALIQAGVRRGSLGENSSASHTRRSFVRLAARERTSTASYS